MHVEELRRTRIAGHVGSRNLGSRLVAAMAIVAWKAEKSAAQLAERLESQRRGLEEQLTQAYEQADQAVASMQRELRTKELLAADLRGVYDQASRTVGGVHAASRGGNATGALAMANAAAAALLGGPSVPRASPGPNQAGPSAGSRRRHTSPLAAIPELSDKSIGGQTIHEADYAPGDFAAGGGGARRGVTADVGTGTSNSKAASWDDALRHMMGEGGLISSPASGSAEVPRQRRNPTAAPSPATGSQVLLHSAVEAPVFATPPRTTRQNGLY